jgi:hypothetical protein
MYSQLTQWQLYSKVPAVLSKYRKWVKAVRAGKPVLGVYRKGKWFVAVPNEDKPGSTLIEVPFQNKPEITNGNVRSSRTGISKDRSGVNPK